MQTVTLCFSAIGASRFSPLTQFSRPSSSLMPLRLPEKVMMFGNPILGHLGNGLLELRQQVVMVLHAVPAVGMLSGPLHMAQISPAFLTVGHSDGPEQFHRFQAHALRTRAQKSSKVILAGLSLPGVNRLP